MNDIFTRVDSNEPLPHVLDAVVKDFQLGTIEKYTPILTGYQDCNIDLRTSSGHFVVKFFSSEKTTERIHDVISGHISCMKAGVPMPKLIKGTNNSFLLEIPGRLHPSFVCVFEYVDGKPLTKTPVTDIDVSTLAHSIALIHTIQKPSNHYYDTMGIINVPNEYKLKHEALSSEEQLEISPVVAKLSRINLSKFHQSIIHGSLEKENILKQADGSICIIDLGCMDYNASVLDIATLIANMTIYSVEEKRRHSIHEIITTYTKSLPISPPEMSALPTLIRAQFAAYIINMTHHMRKDHDMTKQTQTWLDRGWDGFRAYKAYTKIKLEG